MSLFYRVKKVNFILKIPVIIIIVLTFAYSYIHFDHFFSKKQEKLLCIDIENIQKLQNDYFFKKTQLAKSLKDLNYKPLSTFRFRLEFPERYVASKGSNNLIIKVLKNDKFWKLGKEIHCK